MEQPNQNLPEENSEASPMRFTKPELKQQKVREPKKITFSEKQVHKMEEQYVKNKYPSKEVRCELANDFGIPENKIKVWFQNRRIKEKRDRMMSLHSLAIQRQVLATSKDSRRIESRSPMYNVLTLPGKETHLTPPGVQMLSPRCYGQCCAPVCSPDYARYDSLSPLSPYTGGAVLSYQPTGATHGNTLPHYSHQIISGGLLLSPTPTYRMSQPISQYSPLPFFPLRNTPTRTSEPLIPFYL